MKYYELLQTINHPDGYCPEGAIRSQEGWTHEHSITDCEKMPLWFTKVNNPHVPHTIETLEKEIDALLPNCNVFYGKRDVLLEVKRIIKQGQ